MTTAWAGVFFDNTSTPLGVAAFPVSSVPTTPYTVSLLPGDPNFDAFNTALHQPNAGFSHSVLTYAEVYSTSGTNTYWQGQGDLAVIAMPPGHTDLVGHTLTEIDVTFSNMSIGSPQPYPGGGTYCRFNVTENITLQGSLAHRRPYPSLARSLSVACRFCSLWRGANGEPDRNALYER
jgi:hypothetical protein